MALEDSEFVRLCYLHYSQSSLTEVVKASILRSWASHGIDCEIFSLQWGSCFHSYSRSWALSSCSQKELRASLFVALKMVWQPAFRERSIPVNLSFVAAPKRRFSWLDLETRVVAASWYALHSPPLTLRQGRLLVENKGQCLTFVLNLGSL